MRLSSTASLGLVLCLAGCAGDADREQHEQAVALTGGDPRKGIEAIGRYGCASCHDIPGIRPAGAAVGPPLAGIAARGYLAGRLPNSPTNMMTWIQHPQHVERGTAMPEMGVTEGDARDITAFLYTLR
jgi:cytochrome c